MSATEAEFLPASAAPTGGRVAVVASLVAAAAVVLLPLLSFRPNRIVSGVGLRVWEIAHPPTWIAAGALVLAILALTRVPGLAFRAALAFAAIAALLVAAGLGAGAILPGQGFARVSLGSGFWIALIALAVAATDALVRLDLGPAARVAVLAAVVAGAGVVMASGLLADLSLAREYAAYSTEFWAAGREHVVLVVLSLLPALLIGLPLGRWAFRSERARGWSFALLNVFQTTPSVALFAFLMVPLTALAIRFPALRELGVQGIGRTPAVIALFLYALLPITASSLAAFRSVEASVIEAGRAMGMTSRQLLMRVEVPLGMPVFLAGVRVALVQNIGLATIAALVGGGGFGTIVFRGMGQAALDLSLLGALPIVALSLVAVILFDAAIDALKAGRA
ncbi:MAG: ABC transporter permease [Bauldia sp.]|nr:ABC transporter permease [Bauldia sp.]